ncbi:MAG: peptidoglycan editing factor PgeF [Bacteroidaceae bacterium]|nr:peptidoglycan editing factor PgeF [Bacteroidaceae bacterium]
MRLFEYRTDCNIRAFSTCRGGGSGNYESFNVTHYCGDTPEHVAECRKELCRELGIDDDRLLLPRQTHGNRVICIDKGFIEQPKQIQEERLHGIDAIITDLPNLCVGVSTADCIPVLLYDGTKGIAAAVHAGWRGTVARIVQECVSQMRSRYGCDSGNIKAIIAPGISKEAFEVDDEVYETFKESGFDMERIAGRYPALQGEKWHIDLWECNRMQLVEEGIREENIHVSAICTYERYLDFFSARRLGVNSGRIFNGIMITDRA